MAGKQYQIQIKIDGDGKAAVTAINGVNRSLDDNKRKTKAAESEMSSLGTAFGRLSSSAVALLGVAGLGGVALEMVKISERAALLDRGFLAVTGSASLASAELEYLYQVSDRLGINAIETGKTFLGLTAATKGTALAGEQTRDIFEAVSLSMAKLGKSSYETEGALLAIQQMISKTKVTAEELRGQLDERLPGATRIAAESLGVTTEELSKMLEKGEIIADELLPKFSARLKELYDDGKEVTGLTAEWNRFTNQMREFATEAVKASGAVGLIETALRGAGGIMDDYRWFFEMMRTGVNPDKSVAAIEAQAFGYEMLRQEADTAYAAIIEKQTEVARLAKESSGLIGSLVAGPELERSQGELLALAQHLGEVKHRLAEIDIQQEKTWARAAEGAAVASGWSQAMVEATAQTLGWGSGIDSALARLQKAEPILKDAAKASKIPEEALLSVFAMENAFGKLATSAAGAKGPMQFIDGTAAMVAKQMNAAGVATGMTADLIQTDLTAALKAGAFHLADLSGQFDHFYQTLIAYNAGPGKADLPFAKLPKETQDYVRNGIALMEQYARATGNLGAISGEVAAAQDYMAGKVDESSEAFKRAKKEAAKQEKEMKKAAKAFDDVIDAAKRLTREYIPGRAAAEDYAEAQRVLAVAVAAGEVAQKDAADALAGLAKEQRDAIDKTKESASAWGEAWESTIQRVDDAFAQMWVDLIDGTSSTLDALRTGIKRWLAEVAHALLTKPLVVAITATGSATAGAAGVAGQAASAAGSAQSVGYLSKITSLLSSNSIGLGVARGLNSVGQIFGASKTGAFASGLGGLSTTPNWALGGGAIAGGVLGSMLFSGDEAKLGSAIGSSAGSVIGGMLTPVLGPLGPILGGLLGGVGGGGLGSLFGGDQSYPSINVGVQGGQFGVQATNRWGTVDGGTGETARMLEQLNTEMLALAEQLGDGAKAQLAAFQHAGQKLDAENFEQWIADVSAGMLRAMAQGVRDDALAGAGSEMLAGIMTQAMNEAGDDPRAMLAAVEAAKRMEAGINEAVAGIFNSVGPGNLDTTDRSLVATRIYQLADATQEAGENIEGAITRVVTGFDSGMTALRLAGETAANQSVQSIYEIGSALAEFAGGYDKLNAGMTSYYDLFYSEEERKAAAVEAAQRATSYGLAELGLALPGTADEFRALVESLDLTSASGQEAFATLTGLSEEFHLLYDSAEQAGDVIPEITDKFLGLRTSLRELADDLDPQTSTENRAQAESALADAGYTGAFDSAAIAEFLRALAEVDDAGGEATDSLLAVSDALRSALNEAARIADERSGLDLRLLELTASETEYLAEVRRRELEGLDESNRAIQERIYALEDEAKATAEAERIAKESADINIRLLEAQGLSEEALAMRRAQELDAVDESNRAMLLRIYALEDEQAALDELRQAADDAYATLQRSVDAEKEAINASYDAQLKALDAQQKAAQEAHEAQMEALQAQRDASAESLQEIESLLSTIQSAIDGFQLEGLDEDAKAFSESMAELQRMARSPMPIDQEALDAAVGGLSGFSPDDYATRAEYEADYYATMSAMEDIEKRLGAQKTIEEQMLESLDAQIEAADAQYEAQMAAFDAQREALDAWRDDQMAALDAMLEEARAQLDAINGVNTSILSVEEALLQFAEAVGAYNAANAAVNDASLVQLERSADMLEQIAEPGGAMHVPADPDLAQDTSEIADLLRRILESSQSLESQSSEQTTHTRDSASTLKRWDINGLPNERDAAYLEVI